MKTPMKVAILHLSDLHFKSSNNTDLVRLVSQVSSSVRSHITECGKMIIVVSGDIAFSGQSSEYQVAKEFFENLQTELNQIIKVGRIQYIVVPGNHDCDFTRTNKLRDMAIQTINKSDEIHDDFSAPLLEVQTDFWEFASDLMRRSIDSQTSFSIDVPVLQDLSFRFDCYNTALLSTRHESKGGLIVPQNAFIDNSCKKKHVVFSVFHHGFSWLSSSTDKNNMTLFSTHIKKTTNFALYGHEHTNSSVSINDLIQNEHCYLVEAAELNHVDSGFNLLILDTSECLADVKNFSYNSECGCFKQDYNKIVSWDFAGDAFTVRDDYYSELQTIEAPFSHPMKNELLLNDIFVYPDLEHSFIKDKVEYDDYVDAEEVIHSTKSVFFIEGSAQSGKSSLLKKYFLDFDSQGKYPIFLHGSDIQHTNIDRVIKKSFKRQYSKGEYTLYEQADPGSKILLIDNIESSSLNYESIQTLIARYQQLFSKIIITCMPVEKVQDLLFDKETSLRMRIRALGFKKRDTLITKWHFIGTDPLTRDISEIEKQSKLVFDEITGMLGKQLVPSYPIFVLTMLQGLSATSTYDLSKTTYAYCYSIMITASLVRAGVDKTQVEELKSFLMGFAYYVYDKANSNVVPSDEFDLYYNEHKKLFIYNISLDKTIQYLQDANLLVKDCDDCYMFSYKYVYLFLVAEKISIKLTNGEANHIVVDLCNNIHDDTAANILIFLSYHSKSKLLIDELQIASLMPFDDTKELTLKVNDHIFGSLSDVVASLPTDNMIKDVDHNDYRTRKLEVQDRHTYNSTNIAEVDESELYMEFNKSVKIVRILGQIVRSQKSGFAKNDIMGLIKDAFSVTFRSIEYYHQLIVNGKSDIIDYFLEENSTKRYQLDKQQIIERVSKFLYVVLYRILLSCFSNLALSVGMTDKNGIYDEIAKDIDTPAAKLVAFTIKTYYGRLKFNELQELWDEFKDNQIALHILKLRVLSYVYNNNVSFQDKQKISQVCGLKLIAKKNKL